MKLKPLDTGMTAQQLQGCLNDLFNARSRKSYLEDIDQIIAQACTEGYKLTKVQAKMIWKHHSRCVCAGWLGYCGEPMAPIIKNFLLQFQGNT